MNDQRCKSTHIHHVTYLQRIVGVQCKYTTGHLGFHCGYTGYSDGDVTWTDPPIGAPKPVHRAVPDE
jgi:hypothetical protein